MKHFYLAGLLSLSFMGAFAQLSNGGFHAGFGIDGDTKAGFKKYGPGPATPSGDDWFAPAAGQGIGVIDTTNAAYYRTQLQAGRNISFIKSMAFPLFSQNKGRLMMDAIYIRDYC